MFSTHQLVKRFGGVLVTDHVSLSVMPHEVHALIGPNGAGKSTLLNLIAGVLSPDAGRIELHGKDVGRLPMHRRARAGLSRSYQLTSIFREFSLLENLLLAVQSAEGDRASPVRSARRDRALIDRAEALASRVGIESMLSRIAGTLPHGVQRALDLALALATAPKLLLLDEPLAGMGPADSEQMVELISTLRPDTAVLLIEHDMDAVFRLANRISVLDCGRLIASGSADEIKADPRVRAVYLGQEA